MRGPLVLTSLFLIAAFAGCVQGPSPTEALSPVSTDGLFSFSSAERAVIGIPHGAAFVINNTSDRTLNAQLLADPVPAKMGPVLRHDGWVEAAAGDEFAVAPGASILFLVQHIFQAAQNNTTVNVGRLLEPGTAAADERVVASTTWETNVTVVGAARFVRAGDHVLTATVGLWINGTSFYTNMAELNDDPMFPAGYARGEFNGEPLPIYVYDQSNEEQPNSSRDTCNFTTITGYNALLKTQAAGTTGVRYLAPEEAYTFAGAEDFFLYGHGLVFLNTIVAHAGSTGALDMAPDPTGDCFEPNNYSPVELPELPPLARQ